MYTVDDVPNIGYTLKINWFSLNSLKCGETLVRGLHDYWFPCWWEVEWRSSKRRRHPEIDEKIGKEDIYQRLLLQPRQTSIPLFRVFATPILRICNRLLDA